MKGDFWIALPLAHLAREDLGFLIIMRTNSNWRHDNFIAACEQFRPLQCKGCKAKKPDYLSPRRKDAKFGILILLTLRLCALAGGISDSKTLRLPEYLSGRAENVL
jgi:hypothetical protein